ncbi:unnamed protein product [Peronospora belbahrii]|uniref:Uncharacterized protein n=1 Tax=Peronospora belbahrii TaxID=622444 RepID=A0ABN8CT40_9STRA|nr:unnamed protein product [Peronospora belbahrii]
MCVVNIGLKQETGGSIAVGHSTNPGSIELWCTGKDLQLPSADQSESAWIAAMVLAACQLTDEAVLSWWRGVNRVTSWEIEGFTLAFGIKHDAVTMRLSHTGAFAGEKKEPLKMAIAGNGGAGGIVVFSMDFQRNKTKASIVETSASDRFAISHNRQEYTLIIRLQCCSHAPTSIQVGRKSF